MSIPKDFIFAILAGDISKVQAYLSDTLDLNELDDYGFTPLIEATIANQTKIVTLLLGYGVNVNQQDITGRTALHWAADNHNLSICTQLLQYQADPNAYTHAGESILVFPYLRKQEKLKTLLYQHQGKLSFAQDFIQVKLLGQRYSLYGEADIINPHGTFVPVSYEGFFLEFAIELVKYSLERYCQHFVARSVQQYFPLFQVIVALFKNASDLLQYQKYTVNLEAVDHKISAYLDRALLFLPIAYEGHAISFIRYEDILIRCDRGENSQKEGSIVLYQMQKPYHWTTSFLKKLLYEKQSAHFITVGIQDFLGLKFLGTIKREAQTVGNCSWANVEAGVLALLYVLRWKQEGNGVGFAQWVQQVDCHAVYSGWLKWDQSCALEESLQNFKHTNAARKATIATMMGAVLFQALHYQYEEEVRVAAKIIPILMESKYRYILKSYLKIYWFEKRTPEGYNLTQLLNRCGVPLTL